MIYVKFLIPTKTAKDTLQNIFLWFMVFEEEYLSYFVLNQNAW